MRLVSTYLVGLIFAGGIAISGMANPQKVLNVLDIAGTWDLSLMFVVGRATFVAFIGYRPVLPHSAPMIDIKFHRSEGSRVGARPVGGSAVFVMGRGIAGYCPGGAVPALIAGIVKTQGSDRPERRASGTCVAR
jgi:uncharacterized membrane protein YedE/YeeE